MESIEIIEIRLSQDQNEVVEKEIGAMIKDVTEGDSGCAMKLYTRLNLKSDYLIIISHKETRTGHQKSDIGEKIRQALNEFGIINHRVWYKLL